MSLKVSLAMLAAALVVAGAAFVNSFSGPTEPEKVVASEPVAKTIEEPSPSYSEPYETPSRESKAEPEAKPEAQSRADSQVEPKPQPEPAPEPAPEPPTVAGTRWPTPSPSDIEAADKPRRYRLPDGAVMGLTIRDIDVFNAPVFDTGAEWALDSGVRHPPETSMPWSGGAQSNVYLEGHRIGFPGTGSHLIFYNLDSLGNGDEILLRARDGKRYEYRVIDKFVVNPSESWVKGHIRGRDLVTLQTCTGPGYSQRLIVRAEKV